MNVIIIWLAKILKNITCGYGHHLWKYWIYHSWPSATRDKSNIFTRDDHNHTWYFPIFFASHILISHSYVCTTPCINYIHVEYIAYESHREGQEIVQYYLLQSNIIRTRQVIQSYRLDKKLYCHSLALFSYEFGICFNFFSCFIY